MRENIHLPGLAPPNFDKWTRVMLMSQVPNFLFYCNAFSKVPRLIRITTADERKMIGKHLSWDDTCNRSCISQIRNPNIIIKNQSLVRGDPNNEPPTRFDFGCIRNYGL